MAQGTTVLRNGIDTYAGTGDPSANRADSNALALESGNAYAFLFFNRAFPLDATIVKATLRVYTKGSWGITPTLTVRRITERWGVNRLTWNNQPATGGVATQLTQSSAADGHEWALDLTTTMQAVADGATWFGVRIGTDSAAHKLLYAGSSPKHEFRPVLEVTWSRAPQAPTTLSPSGTRAVSIAKPHLRFDFTDHLGSTALQAVHVQIDPTGNWAAPAWDSGTVQATEPELDLAATTYPGLTAGAETRWRVRVQDGAGLWSPWSDVNRFRRDNKGTLAITNPAAAPNDFVSEWTPPIMWTLTGEVQKAWQVFITPDDDRSTRLYDTGRTKGTDTSWTLPKGIIEDDSRYRVFVRVWDSKDRENTPGDPLYTQAERSFAFREDPTPNPVAGLTAENLLPRPHVELTWTRATAPDSFAIKRDGRVIESGLDPADLLTAGTSYRWVDKDAKPHRTHTWVVQAVVNRLTSTNNPSVTTKVLVQGIWITDHDRNIEVFINAQEAGTWAMGEEATTHAPLGRNQGVRITQSMRGWEGTITGTISGGAGNTAEQWEDNLWRIKERPGEVVTLSLGNEAFRCVLGNIVSHPTPTIPITKAVSFDFWQVAPLDYRPRL